MHGIDTPEPMEEGAADTHISRRSSRSSLSRHSSTVSLARNLSSASQIAGGAVRQTSVRSELSRHNSTRSNLSRQGSNHTVILKQNDSDVSALKKSSVQASLPIDELIQMKATQEVTDNSIEDTDEGIDVNTEDNNGFADDEETMESEHDEERLTSEENATPISTTDSILKTLSDPIISGVPLLTPVTSVTMETPAAEPGTATADDVAMEPVIDGPKPIEIAFCFDTTGSMSTCIEAVKENVKTIIQRLFMDIPSLKIAVMAHGDYCDADVFYLYKLVDFTNDVNALCAFVNDVDGTGGGDWEECYELMLRKASDELSWSPQTQKSFVMIGDAIPHLPHYLLPDNVSDKSVSTYKLPVNPGQPINLHWMTELDRLHLLLGVRVYAVQCQKNKHATPFWKHMAESTSGKHLQLDQFNTIIDAIMAICYREQGPELFEAYEQEVRSREGPRIRVELDQLFATLRDREPAADDVDGDGARPGTSDATVKRTPKGGPKAKKATVDRVRGAAKRKTGARVTFAVPGPSTAAVVHATKRRTAKTMTVEERKLGRTATKAAIARKVKANAGNRNITEPKTNRYTVSSRVFRNTLPENIKWSPWHLAMYMTDGKSVSNLSTLFQRSRHQPSVYEISIQTEERKKHRAMFCCHSAGLQNGRTLANHMLSSKRVRKEVQNVLDQNCKIFVRRFVMKKSVTVQEHKLNVSEVKNLMLKKFDYPWNRSEQRLTYVKLSGKVISTGESI